MKIYIATHNSDIDENGDGYDILGVFDSAEKAKKHLEAREGGVPLTWKPDYGMTTVYVNGVSDGRYWNLCVMEQEIQ